MYFESSPSRMPGRLRLFSPAAILIALIVINLFPASGAPSTAGHGQADFSAAAADSCADATVINPSSLPFSENATTVGVANDLDPGAGCAPGLGPDVVYSFTPSASDTYTVGATPLDQSFDMSLYVVTDCADPGGSCVAGSNARGFGRGESVSADLNAGTRYFIVIDSPQAAGQGGFSFSLRRGVPANDTCAAPAIIESNRLPFSATGSTFGAANDLIPSVPCVRSAQSGTGPDVIYQFTSPDSQNYDIAVTPVGNFDLSLYVVTDCATLAGCSSSDFGGGGEAESLRRNLTEGVTYFIVVDGFQGDAGNFSISLVPTIIRTPAAPTGLVARAISSAQIDLTWVDNSDNEQGFRIERSLDGQNFAEVASVGPNVTSFSDTTVSAGTTFFYRVFAFNAFGNSDASNVAADTTPGPPVPNFPVIALDPASIDFGSVRATQTATRTITVRNAGGADLVISAIGDPASPFSIVDKPELPLTIAPGETRELLVRFSPQFAVRSVGSFAIQSNDPTNSFAIVNLEGTGASAPVSNLEVTPALADFPGGSSATPLEIKNTGDADLIVSSITRPAAPFTLSGVPPLPAVIRPGEKIVLTLSFSPSQPGVFSSSITVVSNDPDALLFFVPVRGTSTPQAELLKLRAPTQFTAIIGQANTMNVIAVNGTNTDIRLSATPVQGGVFTDRGNGRGDLVLTPQVSARTTLQVTFTATDSANAIKTLQSFITVIPAGDTWRVQVRWVAPEVASNAPTGVAAVNQNFPSITAAPDPIESAEAEGFNPAVAPGLVGYVIYRSDTRGAAPSLGNIVGIAPASATSFNDAIPTPGGNVLNQPFFYRVTALYQSGTESAASNESSTEPRLVGLQFSSKRLRFRAADSNVEAGAVLLVDGRERFVLERNGDFVQVAKNTRSTPGNLRIRDVLTRGTAHTLQVINPHGPPSQVVSFTR